MIYFYLKWKFKRMPIEQTHYIERVLYLIFILEVLHCCVARSEVKRGLHLQSGCMNACPGIPTLTDPVTPWATPPSTLWWRGWTRWPVSSLPAPGEDKVDKGPELLTLPPHLCSSFQLLYKIWAEQGLYLRSLGVILLLTFYKNCPWLLLNENSQT